MDIWVIAGIILIIAAIIMLSNKNKIGVKNEKSKETSTTNPFINYLKRDWVSFKELSGLLVPAILVVAVVLFLVNGALNKFETGRQNYNKANPSWFVQTMHE